MDLQPTLAGPRITIRPIRSEDWAELSQAASDPEIWAQHPANDRYQERVFRQFFDEAINSGAAFVFVDRKTNSLIGSSRYHGFDAGTKEVEIGWTFLTRDYWGGSYNGEIKKLMLEHAFKYVDTVVFWIGEANWRSRKAVEKIGARQRQGSRESVYNGRPQTDVIYEIRSAWFRH